MRESAIIYCKDDTAFENSIKLFLSNVGKIVLRTLQDNRKVSWN